MVSTYQRQFSPDCTEGPYRDVKTSKRDVVITRTNGQVVFRQNEVEAPIDWSDTAVQIVAQKYFRGKIDANGNPEAGRETSILQLIDRVVNTIAGWAGYYDNGKAVYTRPEKFVDGYDLDSNSAYFDGRESWLAWMDDLKWLLVNQHFAFNSPVWFNVGMDDHPQCSACFILRLNDTMSGAKDSEFDLDGHGLLAAQVKEGLIFSRGSGSGINLSRVRSSKEWLSSGGRPTGPMSFARGLDTWAASIKSGGKTRRAAKMLIMDVDHPDIVEFIDCKAAEEEIAKKLIAAGMSPDMDGEAYQHAFHQNSNLSVRVNDAFMDAVLADAPWSLVSRSDHFLNGRDLTSMIGIKGKETSTVSAKDLFTRIARQAWACGDPGIQFHDTINQWHTCANTELIFASNPCSEYMFLDETSCNLSSLNLCKFFAPGGDVQKQIERFNRAIDAITIAMDVIVSCSKYPTKNIERQSRTYRTLGVGFANLGNLLMSRGLPYDSEKGRDLAAAITSMMTARVYITSSKLAERLGSFAKFEDNRECFTNVMRQHAAYASVLSIEVEIQADELTIALANTSYDHWELLVNRCEGHSSLGIRNAQATVLAPTGTIAFLMDCDTTGIEPDLGLVKYKTLSGGGTLKLVNNALVANLVSIGKFSRQDAEAVAKEVANGISIRHLVKDPNLAEVFRTSFPPADDPDFCLSWQAHVDMMAACQPFISGAISKTVNMPSTATPDDIAEAYKYAWEAGLKAIAIYRDGSKGVQAISTTKTEDGRTSNVDTKQIELELQAAESRIAELENAINQGLSIRRKPDTEVIHVRTKFEIEGHSGYLFVGFYKDTNQPCEIFVWLSKEGSALRGFTDAFCISFSMLLQYGVPLDKLISQFEHMEFEPKGAIAGDIDIRSCQSVIDYIVRKVQAVAHRKAHIYVGEADTIDPAFDASESRTWTSTHNVEYVAPASVTTGKSSGRACARCGSFNVNIVGKCLICHSCGSEEGGCFA
jgi:ribonucleoside-diphosphate reductase alpha chain